MKKARHGSENSALRPFANARRAKQQYRTKSPGFGHNVPAEVLFKNQDQEIDLVVRAIAQPNKIQPKFLIGTCGQFRTDFGTYAASNRRTVEPEFGLNRDEMGSLRAEALGRPSYTRLSVAC